MHLGRSGVAGLLLSATAFAPSAAADSDVPWLVEINRAARTSNYQGVVVNRNATGRESKRVIHRHQDGIEREYLQYLGSSPREILRQGRKVSVIEPQTRSVLIETNSSEVTFPIMSDEAVKATIEHYEVAHVGNLQVAGRLCNNLNVYPRDAYRYRYELCVDHQRRVPLRVVLRDNAGNPLEETMFWEVSFPEAIADTELVSRTDVAGYQKISSPARVATAPTTAWTLSALPPGFRLLARELRNIGGTPGRVEHLLISDGLSMVSVYSARTVAPGAIGVTQNGGLHSYGRPVGPFHVTVVGEVPEATVKMIGDGLVAPQDAEADPE